MNRSLRVAFFGGTFDPVHLGHLEIAQKARRALQLDEIIFLPCKQSPHKDSGPAASDDDRVHMLQLATTRFPWARVSRYELDAPPPSYTWKTLETLIPRYRQDTRFFLLIGLDQWEALPRWQHPEKIAAMVQFIVVGRKGQPAPRPGYQAHFIRGDHPASASGIRSSLASGQQAQWLPPEIASFLQSNELYRK